VHNFELGHVYMLYKHFSLSYIHVCTFFVAGCAKVIMNALQGLLCLLLTGSVLWSTIESGKFIACAHVFVPGGP